MDGRSRRWDQEEWMGADADEGGPRDGERDKTC
jgi:hypothetical protein